MNILYKLNKFFIGASLVVLIITLGNYFIGPSFDLHEVGFQYWGNPFPYIIGPLSEEFVHITVAFIYLSNSLIIGIIACNYLFQIDQYSWSILKLSLAWLLGLLISIALIRIVTLIAPIIFALLLMIFLGIASFFSFIKFINKEFIKNLSAIILLVIFISILSIQTGAIHILGDGDVFYLGLIENGTIDLFRSLPLFSQHYHSILLLSPLIALTNPANSIVYWWIYVAVVKTISLVLVYSASKKYLSKLTALLLTFLIFFYFGSLSPLNYLLNFDAGSILFFISDSSRVLIVAFTIYIFANKTELSSLNINRNIYFYIIGFLSVLGLGSFQHQVLIPFVLFFYLLILDCNKEIKLDINEKEKLLPTLMFIFFITMALWANSDFTWYITFIPLILLFYINFNRISHFLRIVFSKRKNILNNKPYVFLFFSFFLCLLFFGNLISLKFLNFFINTDAIFYNRLQFGDEVLGASLFSLGETKYCNTRPFIACKNIGRLLLFYGFPMLIFTICIISNIYSKDKIFDLEIQSSKNLLFSLFIFFIWISLFTNGGLNDGSVLSMTNTWIKTRLVELFYYPLIWVGVIILGMKFKKTTTSVLFILIISQYLYNGNHPIGYFYNNLSYILQI